MGGGLLTAAVDRAAQAGLQAAAALWATPGAADVESVSRAVTAAVVHELAISRCLVEPKPETPAMTIEEAARLLCALSCSPRLSDPDDWHSLLTSDAMVTYAWRQATGAGIPPTQMSDAHLARRLLMEHHRRAARE